MWVWYGSGLYTVKKRLHCKKSWRRHPHLMTQDQFSLVSEKVFGIPEENFTKNIELFWQTFTNVKLLWQNWKVSKCSNSMPRLEPHSSGIPSDTLPLHHTSLCFKYKDLTNNFINRRDGCLRHGPAVWKCKPIPNRKFELPYSSLFFLTYLYFVPTTISSSRYTVFLP